MDSEIRYRRLRQSDRDSVENMLYTSFILQDPLEVSLAIERPSEARVLVEPFFDWTLADGLSLVAEHVPSGELVGVCLNTVDTGVKRCVTVPVDDPDGAKMKLVIEFLKSMRAGSDLGKKFSLEKVVDIQIVNVRSQFGGKGIGRSLVLESIIIAKEKGCTTACAEATGIYSQRLFESLGFTTIKEVCYANYFKDGMQIFLNTGIHTSCRLVAKALQ